MRTEIARGLDLEANRFDIEPEITAKLLRAGHTIVELPGSFRAAQPRPGQEDRLARRLPGDLRPLQAALALMAERGAALGMTRDRVPAAAALVVAIAVALVGVVKGTWAVGGSDSSCYALDGRRLCQRRLATEIVDSRRPRHGRTRLERWLPRDSSRRQTKPARRRRFARRDSRSCWRRFDGWAGLTASSS